MILPSGAPNTAFSGALTKAPSFVLPAAAAGVHLQSSLHGPARFTHSSVRCVNGALALGLASTKELDGGNGVQWRGGQALRSAQGDQCAVNVAPAKVETVLNRDWVDPGAAKGLKRPCIQA
jgi:hypothetical protein